MSEENYGEVPIAKDLEGVDEAFKSIPKPKGDRQKKIAVLTSGGDSAGMNAAGGFISTFSGGILPLYIYSRGPSCLLSTKKDRCLTCSPSSRSSRYR